MALFVLLSASGLIVFLSIFLFVANRLHIVDVGERAYADIQSAVEQAYEAGKTPDVLTASYRASMTDFIAQAETIDPEIFFQEADRLFLSVSVPKEMMDAHLETFIKIQALRANPDQRDMAAVQAEAVAVLRELSSALNSL